MMTLSTFLPMPAVEITKANHPPADSQVPHADAAPSFSLPLPPGTGSPNRLLRAAQPLLEYIPSLKQCAAPPSLQDLREQLIALVTAFGTYASQAGVAENTVIMARYCLCTLMDEVIANTLWGKDAWGGSGSLLVIFHHEASGGERFFRILQWLAQVPQQHLEALEFIHVLLALGIEGRYRLQEGGHSALAQVRERLYLLIRAQRGNLDTPPLTLPEPSIVARPRAKPQRRWFRPTLVLILSVLVLGYFVGDYLLAKEAGRLLAALQQDPSSVIPLALPISAAPPSQPSGLATLLAPEVAKRTISIDTQNDRTIITLHVDSLFDIGSAKVRAGDAALLRTIGQALATVPGRVIITGHSDNTPTRAGALTNWALSQQRAAATAAILAEQSSQPERFLAQGRGATEPLVANDTPAHRAQNRRVTITLLTSENRL